MRQEELQQEAQQAIEEKELNSNIVGGLIGGIIGGAIGAIPVLVVLYFFHYFVGVLFVAIPLGTFFGWKILGGKPTKITKGFTIIYTLVVTFGVWVLAQAIILRYVLDSELGYEITMGESLGYVMDILGEGLFEFIIYDFRNVMFAFGSAVVGIVIAWRYIDGTNEKDLDYEQASLEEGNPSESSAPEAGTPPVEEEQDLDTPVEENESSEV